MFDEHEELREVVQPVHDTMKIVKGKVEKCHILRNLTGLNPAIVNVTRWSGKVMVLERWTKI